MHDNRLIYESSPYLQQHAHNPVDWWPWSPDALKKAEEEDKMLLISIGYSACHWCHVMEHESFESEEVAQLMNEHFVCIKVDREERPDVDQVYMDAIQMLTGRGGWPLNCFALPDGRPVWGGTYFPTQQWVQVIQHLSQLYKNDRSKIIQQADGLMQGISQQGFPELKTNPPEIDLDAIVEILAKDVDYQHGGFSPAPKFPMPVLLNFLMAIGHQENNEGLLRFVNFSLDRMALGGLYDQVGGGFTRYSVDARWMVPHFEKMLYDNGQLLALYADAYRLTHKDLYKNVIEQSFDFLQREMQAPDGTFYSALDADSEGEEGRFYIWKYSELVDVLGEEMDFFEYYNISEKGNWEHGQNILHAEKTIEKYAEDKGLKPEALKKRFHANVNKLFIARDKRIRPGLDNKVLSSWNAMVMKGLCQAYQALADDKYLNVAQKAMSALLAKMMTDEGKLYRAFKSEEIGIDGFLDDYAFVIDALLSLYEVSFNEEYLNKAKALVDYVMDYFYDEANGIFYYTASNGEQLVARKTDVQDNVIPSSVGTMVNNLMRLSQLEYNSDYELIAELMIKKMQAMANEHPRYYSQWALLAHQWKVGREELVIVGERAEMYRQELQKQYRPYAMYAGSLDGASQLEVLQNRFQANQTLIYKCHQKSCDLPFVSPTDLD